MFDPVSLFDPALATPTERAVLMCIERIGELERKLQEAERTSIANLLTVTGEDHIVVYIETICFVLGLSPQEFLRRKQSVFHMSVPRGAHVWAMFPRILEWAASTLHNPAALRRAEELHSACFPAAATCPFWSTEFDCTLPDEEYRRRSDVIAMLRVLTVGEAERLWEWRLVRAGWRRGQAP